MEILSCFSVRDDDNGRVFTQPSMTVPDLCYSIQQLAHDYSIGQLPPLSRLVYDDLSDLQEKEMTDNLEFDNYSDIRPHDRLEGMIMYKESKITLDSIRERVRSMREFKAKSSVDASQPDLASVDASHPDLAQ